MASVFTAICFSEGVQSNLRYPLAVQIAGACHSGSSGCNQNTRRWLGYRAGGKICSRHEDPALPQAKWRWIPRHLAAIDAILKAGQVISAQITYAPGWRATVQGKPQKIYADKLDYIVVRPVCLGARAIYLPYDGGPEWRFGWLLREMVMLFAIGRRLSRAGFVPGILRRDSTASYR